MRENNFYVENENDIYRKQFNYFYENARKFIKLLKDNKYLPMSKIKKLQKRFRKTFISVTTKSNVAMMDNKNKKSISLYQNAGTTLSLLLSGRVQPQVCIIYLKDLEEKEIRQVMFHELMHIVTKKIFKEENNYKVYSGMSIFEDRCQYNLLINEGLTEIIAKKLYEKIYEEKYNLFRIESKKYFDVTLTMYNFLNNLDDKEIMDIYFNNKVDRFEKIVKENSNLDLFELEELFEERKYAYVISLLKKPISKKEIMKKYY